MGYDDRTALVAEFSLCPRTINPMFNWIAGHFFVALGLSPLATSQSLMDQ